MNNLTVIVIDGANLAAAAKLAGVSIDFGKLPEVLAGVGANDPILS